MRQRKATAYPHVGALVQPRPEDRYLTAARLAMRMTLQASRVKGSCAVTTDVFVTVACRTPASLTRNRHLMRSRLRRLARLEATQHGPLLIVGTLASPSMIKRPVPVVLSDSMLSVLRGRLYLICSPTL
jgi:hypothetical protein